MISYDECTNAVIVLLGIHRQESPAVDRRESAAGTSVSWLQTDAGPAQYNDPLCSGAAIQLQAILRSHPGAAVAV